MAVSPFSRMVLKRLPGLLGRTLITVLLLIVLVMVTTCLAIAENMTFAISWLSRSFTIGRRRLSGQWRTENSLMEKPQRMRNLQPKRYSGFSEQMSGQFLPELTGTKSGSSLSKLE